MEILPIVEELFIVDPAGAFKMAEGAGFVAVETAGAAIEGLANLDNIFIVGQGAKAEGGDGGAIDRGDGGIHSGGKMHGGGVVGVIHGRAALEGGGLEETQLAREVDDRWAGRCGRVAYCLPDRFAKSVIGRGAEEIDGV